MREIEGWCGSPRPEGRRTRESTALESGATMRSRMAGTAVPGRAKLKAQSSKLKGLEWGNIARMHDATDRNHGRDGHATSRLVAWPMNLPCLDVPQVPRFAGPVRWREAFAVASSAGPAFGTARRSMVRRPARPRTRGRGRCATSPLATIGRPLRGLKNSEPRGGDHRHSARSLRAVSFASGGRKEHSKWPQAPARLG